MKSLGRIPLAHIRTDDRRRVKAVRQSGKRVRSTAQCQVPPVRTKRCSLLKLNLRILEVRSPADLDEAVLAAAQSKVDTLLILSSPVFGANSKRIAVLTLGHRLPAVTLFPDFARAGGLMAYGPNLLDTYRQLGGMVAKVLRGTKPADLPVELPTKFELVINVKTAKALGLEVPTSILLRADEVIE
jgi:putative tryptophan/tyrosine transport system substrate-binding protein